MHPHARRVTLLAVFAMFGPALAANARQPEAVKALDGEWVFVEDRTEGRPKEQHSPNMGPRLKLRVEKDAVVLVRSDGEIRLALDGTPTDVVRSFGTSRYSGKWKDGSFTYESVPVRKGDNSGKGTIRWKLSVTADGMLASVSIDSGKESVSLFKHPKDIELPKPATAAIKDLAWLAGTWTGTRGEAGTTTIEERWSPPGGGAMLAVSRTVSRAKDRMIAFEYLRIVERDGGLVYIAQPGGRPPTEFVLTELGKTRAVFENPRHDFPQRIVYELADGRLSASIGYTKGGKPQRYEFKHEGN